MATSQSQKIAVQKYRAKTYDTIGFDVKKGMRDEYKKIAAKLGLSLAAFLTNAADEFARNHADPDLVALNGQPTDEQPEKLSADDRKLIDAFARCPDNVKPTIRKLIMQLADNEQNKNVVP